LTPAGHHARKVEAELIATSVAGSPRYPNNLSIIPTDIEGFAEGIASSAARGHPILLVYPDGRECLLRPEKELDEAAANAEFDALIGDVPKPVGDGR
jgi:hypothetical protein